MRLQGRARATGAKAKGGGEGDGDRGMASEGVGLARGVSAGRWRRRGAETG